MTMQTPGAAPPIQNTVATGMGATPTAAPQLVDTTSADQLKQNEEADRPSPLAAGVKDAAAAAGDRLRSAAQSSTPDLFHMVFGGHAPTSTPAPMATTPAPAITVSSAPTAPPPVVAPPISMPPPIAAPPPMQPPPMMSQQTAPRPMVSDRNAKHMVRPGRSDVWRFLEALERARRPEPDPPAWPVGLRR